MSATKNEREHVRKPRGEKIVFQITSSAHDTLPPETLLLNCVIDGGAYEITPDGGCTSVS